MIRRWLARVLGVDAEVERIRRLCRVYGVNPGQVKTRGTKADIDTAVRDYLEAMLPLGVAVQSEWLTDNCLVLKFYGRRL